MLCDNPTTKSGFIRNLIIIQTCSSFFRNNRTMTHQYTSEQTKLITLTAS